MGTVYAATDLSLNRTVALKQTFFRSDDLLRAFEREARLMSRLRHPSIPVVSDYFSEAGSYYFVMDYVPGKDLADLLDANGRPLEVAGALRAACELLEALEYLHGHEPPIIHRDIKPHNLKLGPTGRVMLLDFGLAKGTASDVSRESSPLQRRDEATL